MPAKVQISASLSFSLSLSLSLSRWDKNDYLSS